MNTPSLGRILTLNRGSATLKGAIYEVTPSIQLTLSISVDRADSPGSHVTIKDKFGARLLDSSVEKTGSNAALRMMFDWLDARGYLAKLIAAGHRLVHGGLQFQKPVRITSAILAELQGLVPLDPDHLPAALGVIRFVAQRLPDLPQVGCFDTAFHSSLPKIARMYALPRRFFDSGVMRFGFHGLSYEYIVRRTPHARRLPRGWTRDHRAPW